MKYSFKKNNKAKQRKRVNKYKSNINELPKNGKKLECIMDKADKEVEMLLNDLAQQEDEDIYGIKSSFNNKNKYFFIL